MNTRGIYFGRAFGRQVALTPAERRLGRLLRAPDHPGQDGGDGGDSNQSGENNNDGNNDANGGGGSNSPNNNDGQFDATSFWNSPSPANANPPARESAGNGNAGGGTNGTGNSDVDFATQFREQVSSVQFPPVFTDDVARALADGDFTAANNAIAESNRQAMTQGIKFALQLISHQGQAMRNEFRSLVESRFSDRDKASTLQTEFPELYGNPAVAPIVESTFEQALKLSGGNRQKAAETTKQMLRIFASTLAGSGYEDTNQRNQSERMPDASRSLIDSLLGGR